MADQSKAWTSRDPMAAMGDNEQDDCDHEDTTRQRKAKHPASAIRTDSTNRSRSATGKWWGWSNGHVRTSTHHAPPQLPDPGTRLHRGGRHGEHTGASRRQPAEARRQPPPGTEKSAAGEIPGRKTFRPPPPLGKLARLHIAG